MIKIFLILISLLAIVACKSAGDSRNQQKADLHLRLGTNNLERGNYPDALKDLLIAESLAPNEPLTQNNLGLAYFMREKYDQAEIHIRKAIELEPKFTDAKNNLGRVLIEKKKFADAKKYLNEVLEDLTYPMPGKAYINLGLASFGEQAYGEAKEYFLKAINFDRENCLAQNYYARSLLELKEYKKAVTAFDKAEAFCAKQSFDEPSYFSAVNSYRMGDTYKAKLKFEALIEKNSSYREKAEQMLEVLRK
jgi:Tfp pilus assembly protein PilF